MKISLCAAAILVFAPLASIAAQSQQGQTSAPAAQQQDSLAEAAKRAREQKKDHPKPAKVWDNSNLPTNSKISVVGNESDAGAAPQPAPTEKPGSAPANPGSKAAVQGQFDELKKQLESLQTDLDIAQRQYILDDQMYRSEPNFSSDKDGAAAMKAEKAAVEAKHEQVVEAQKKLDELQAQLDSAVVSSSGNTQENGK